MKDQTIDSKLLFAQNAIANALGIKEISTPLSMFGYNDNRLKEGETLYNTASDLHIKQVKEYGEQYAATDTFQLVRAKANKIYMVHVKIARVALRGDREASTSLQLTGNRKASLSGWIKQAKSFYTNALNTSKAMEGLAQFGINKQQLILGSALITDLENKYNAQLKEKGEAQMATQARDNALDDLQEWISDFVAIARIAFSTEPQLLEIVGIVEPS